MNGRIALCVPSRGRASILARLVRSFQQTTSGNADLLIRNGEKDPTCAEYAVFDGIDSVIRVVGTDDGFGWPTATYCLAIEDLRLRYPDYSYYAMMEDDCTLLDSGWDKWLIDAFETFPNRVGVIHLVDVSNQIHALAASAEWINAVGHFMCPELREEAFDGLMRLAGSSMKQGTGARILHRPVPPHEGRGGFIYTGYADTRSYWDEDVRSFARWDMTEYQKRILTAQEAR